MRTPSFRRAQAGAAVLVLVSAASCTTTQQARVIQPLTAPAPASVLVLPPAQLGLPPLAAGAVARAIAEHLQARGISAAVAEANQPAETACAQARQHALVAVALVQVDRWEEHDTEWSGIKDKLDLRVSLLSANNGECMASAVTSAKSKWLTFGGDRVEDLVPLAAAECVRRLFPDAKATTEDRNARPKH